jgi:DNA-binding transcriptional ArsR family regulator
MPGIGVGFVPDALNRAVLDEVVAVTGEEAFGCVRRLAREGGILASVSSGAALHAAPRSQPAKTPPGRRSSCSSPTRRSATSARRSLSDKVNLMVNLPPQLDATFAALADATRRSIVTRVAERERSISELAEPLSMSLPAVSKHVHVLKRAGLVSLEKRGRTTYCRLATDPLVDATDWIAEQRSFWLRQLQSLDRHLREQGERDGDD